MQVGGDLLGSVFEAQHYDLPRSDLNRCKSSRRSIQGSEREAYSTRVDHDTSGPLGRSSIGPGKIILKFISEPFGSRLKGSDPFNIRILIKDQNEIRIRFRRFCVMMKIL